MNEQRCRVCFAESARDDLRDILDWHASHQAPQVGTRIVLEILDWARQLGMFPDSGRVVPEFDAPSLRELEHPLFRIVYRQGENTVTVVRVWRSERLMKLGPAEDG